MVAARRPPRRAVYLSKNRHTPLAIAYPVADAAKISSARHRGGSRRSSGRSPYPGVVDRRAKHDLKWVIVWAVTTVGFASIGHFTHTAWWIGALITGTFLYFYGVASVNAWRDRVAEAKRDDEDDRQERPREEQGSARHPAGEHGWRAE